MSLIYILGEDSACTEIGKILVKKISEDTIISSTQIAGGFGSLVEKIEKMNSIARNAMPVLIIADGDQNQCVVAQVKSWLPKNPSERLSLRLIVRSAESWLLSDQNSLSDFLGISSDLIPNTPEAILNPKDALLNLVKKSKHRIYREEMLPRKGSSSKVGLGYNVHLSNFIQNHWDPFKAAERAPSLARALPRILQILS